VFDRFDGITAIEQFLDELFAGHWIVRGIMPALGVFSKVGRIFDCVFWYHRALLSLNVPGFPGVSINPK
jgi:hypothetical protein